MNKPDISAKAARYLLAMACIAAVIGCTASAQAETATFKFAPLGSSFSAALPADSPLIGKEIVSARIYLDVESFPRSDAANFFTDISFPIEPFPGNTNALVLAGADLGWSGSGTFHYFEETTRFNGTFQPYRYGGETPGQDFDGLLLDTSRIEFDYKSSDDLALTSAASRKTQGSSGAFDVNLPLTGEMGIENRVGGQSEIVFTFSQNVTGAANATATCGKVGSAKVDPNDPHSLTVRMSDLNCDRTAVTVTITGVTDDQGHTLSSASVTFGILFGDVTGNRCVGKGDLAAIRSALGQTTDNTNFRADINTDGRINHRDIGHLKSYQGDSLP